MLRGGGPIRDRPHTAAGQLPERIGRYRVISELGVGAMGAVLLARDDTLERDVAIKVCRPPRSAEPDLVHLYQERFAQEARALAALAHPNIVQVFDVLFEQGVPHLVMERVEGPTLSKRLPLSSDEVRQLGIQLARALHAAHSRQILHRDVKPANVVQAERGVWKLLDFGIARLPDSSLTVLGQFLGTPGYAAPESLLEGQFSPASDVYSLGATLYAAICGHPPHGDSGLVTMAGVASTGEEPEPLRSTHPEVSTQVERAVLGACAHDPNARPSAQALAEQLATATHPPPGLAPVEPPGAGRQQLPDGVTRRTAWWIAGATLVAVVTTTALVVMPRLTSDPDLVPLVRVDPPPDVEPEREVEPRERARPSNQLPRTHETAEAADAGTGEAPDETSEGAAASPWEGEPLPPDLARIQARVDAGRSVHRSWDVRLSRYAVRHPSDCRPNLLLARIYLSRDWHRDALQQYLRAYRRDRRARNDRNMLPGLILLARRRNVGRGAAQAIVQIYGPDALPAVRSALRSPDLRGNARARLRRLGEMIERAIQRSPLETP